MSISASTLSPKFSGVEALVSPKLTGTKLDKEFVRAFESLDLKRAAEFVKMGANSNQEITLSKSVVAEFLKSQTLCDCSGPVNVEEFVADDENFELTINEFFGGITSFPALFLSMVLEKEEFSLLLLENGAETLFQVGEETCNILLFASMANLPEVVKYALQNTSYSVDSIGDEDESPFETAVKYGHVDVIKLFLEMRPDQVEPIILDILEDEGFQNEIEEGNLKLIEIKGLLEDHLQRKEITTAVKV